MSARQLLILATLALSSALVHAELKDDFFAAVRTNDVKTVEALLAKGVDVNVKFRYDQTALFPACDKGYTEMVRVLLAHGAKVDVEDTFYHATPMTWAVEHGHAEIVKLLLEKGAKGKDDALMGGVSGNHPDLVKVVLDAGGVKPETMSRALKAAARDKHDDIAEMLKKAGAVMPEVPSFKVDEATLKSYAGEYKSITGPALTWVLKDGKLSGGVEGQRPLTLGAFSKEKFAALEVDGIGITFTVEGDKVTGLVLNQGSFTAKYTKSEAK